MHSKQDRRPEQLEPELLPLVCSSIDVSTLHVLVAGDVGRLAAVELDDGQTISARLVVGADGARSRFGTVRQSKAQVLTTRQHLLAA